MRRVAVQVVAVLGALGAAGCATLQIKDAATLDANLVLPPHATLPLTVGIREVIPPRTLSATEHGALAKLFAEQLAQAQVFARVLFPVRPEDQPDAMLEVSYWSDVPYGPTNFYQHFWENFGRGFLVVVPYRLDLETAAQVTVEIAGYPPKPYRLESDTQLAVYWWGVFFQEALQRRWREVLDRHYAQVQALLIRRLLQDAAWFAQVAAARARPSSHRLVTTARTALLRVPGGTGRGGS